MKFYVILGVSLLLLWSCGTDSHERKAKADANSFLKNIRNTEQLMLHPMVESQDLPASVARENKKRNFENFKASVNQLCGESSDFKLVNTEKKTDTDLGELIFLEFEYCKAITIVMGYTQKAEGVILYSIWPMNKDDRPADLFDKGKLWD